MIGKIGETNPLAQSLYVDHTEWINRHVPLEHAVPDIGYGFQAFITEETRMEFENGDPAELKDFKPGQKVKVLPPTEETLPVEVDYKKELGIEKLPVILVFDTKELLFKTYQEKELYNFFNERIE
ncbi:hypothetical protein QWY15_12150 [Planococcus sp. N064]|uniref:Uncharacterized protein n=1 Tax=Planococcus liqunii TaxID=3058394 RepID=A0ABT8MT18_9BACL|nr:hypothetical protein [Planococcus sp. N064]MDN7228050.1 hypothetical protein [Planococcus sp. N064]